MKTSLFVSTLCCMILAASTVFGQTKLFEQKNLAEWTFHADKDGVKVDEVFSFDGDTLKCKGEPFGYLATKKKYKNFTLSFEYRWPEGVKPTNSGIFLRMAGQPENTFLPKTIEAQLQHGNAGDLWGFLGKKLPAFAAEPTERFIEREGNEKTGIMNGVKRIVADAEVEPGQWNAVEILCADGLVVVSLNSKIVNWAFDVEPVAGPLGFQSEGGPIEFRGAVLNELP